MFINDKNNIGISEINKYILFETENNEDGPGFKIFNVDIDGDDISDDIKGRCPSSLEMPDSCNINIKYSSNLNVDFYPPLGRRFFMMKFISKYFIIASSSGYEKSTAYLVNGFGVHKYCEIQ